MASIANDSRNRSGSTMSSTVVGILGTLLSVFLTIVFPIVAPAVALPALIFAIVRYRATKGTLWMVLAVISGLALVASAAIDLGLLSAESGSTVDQGPIPTER